MCDKELLVAYLYDDLPAADRAAFDSHLRECGGCRDELKALGGVRTDLAAWTLPQADLGFRVVRGASETGHVLRMPARSWRAWYTPAAGLAAAAVLVLAAASAIARVEVHRGPDGTTVRTGWTSAPAASSSGRVAGMGLASGTARDVHLTTASTVDAGFVAELERRLSALEASLSRDSGVRNASTLSARAADAEILKRVRELLAQSETRQKGELLFRIAQLMRDVDAQRVADLTRIQQGLGRIDATVTAEAASHRDQTNLILTLAKQK